MQLLFELLSDTCISSGESIAGIIDVEVEFDEYGIPFIPAKRLKGVLREAAEDINLICDGKYSDCIDDIFGKPGKCIPGNMILENGRLEDYKEIVDIVRRGKTSKEYGILFNEEFIKDNFTYIRSQTAIDEDGVAKVNSLRNIRVLKKGLKFLFNLEIEKEYVQFLNEVCKMVRHIGLNRTRGLGEVKLSLVEDDENIKVGIQGDKKVEIKDNKLNYKIKLKEPCVLDTEYISGSSILGIFASKHIKLNNIGGNNAHENDEFVNLFLFDKVIFSNAYLTINDEKLLPTPITFLKEKNSLRKDIYNLWDESIFEEDRQYNSLLYDYGILEEDVFKGHNVEKYINYHHRRPSDKTIGRPIKENGDYYQYTCIKEGTEFKGELIGEEIFLDKLMKLFENDNSIWIGASRNAQYGKAEIEFQTYEQNSYDIEENKVAILLTSPMIIRNKFGLYSTSKEDLLEELGLKKYRDNIEVYLKTVEIGGFNSKWGLPKERVAAIKEGSVIVIDNVTIDDVYEIVDRSYGERINEGFGRVEIINHNLEDELSFTDMKKHSNTMELTETEIKECKHKYIINNSLEKLFTKKVIDLYLSKKDSLNEFKTFILGKDISNNIIDNLLTYLNTSKSFKEFDNQLIRASERSTENEANNNEYEDIKRYLMMKSVNGSFNTVLKFQDIIQSDFINGTGNKASDNIFKSEIGRDFLQNEEQFELFKIYLNKTLTMLKYDKGNRGDKDGE